MDSAQNQNRDRLPAKAPALNDFSLWSVLKQAIGKELSKITMPIQTNEPISFLQRLTEYMEYSHLLLRASEAADPIERIQYVTSFAVSGLASNWLRLGKPFNPLLGETFQLERPDFRIVCEQVSHHPPISAFHAESRNAFRFHGSIHPKIKFWGKSVEIQPKGTLTVELTSWNETYTWSNVNCCVHNVIVGKLWIEQYGTMEIVNHSTGHRCELSFKPAGWFSRDLHHIEGFVTDPSKVRKSFVFGKWTDVIKFTDIVSYEEYINSNPHRTTKHGANKETTSHTPRKMLAKLNSLTIGSFRQSTDESNGCDEGSLPPELPNGEIPKSDSALSLNIPNSVTLWTVDPRPTHSPEYYHFTSYAMRLNEMPPPEEKKKLCPTDSRFRPDIRLMEEGLINQAAEEKTRLEEKQREARKTRKNHKDKERKARWFSPGVHPFTKHEDWFYCGGFWDNEVWENETSADIF